MYSLASFALLYALCSIVVFLLPLRRRAKLIVERPIWVSAHRGGAAERPENTLCAFRNASDISEHLELDVALTKDRQIVVVHDAHLTRLCGQDLWVNRVNYDDLPMVKADVELPHGFWEDGTRLNWKKPVALEDRHAYRMPLLREVLDEFAISGSQFSFPQYFDF